MLLGGALFIYIFSSTPPYTSKKIWISFHLFLQFFLNFQFEISREKKSVRPSTFFFLFYSILLVKVGRWLQTGKWKRMEIFGWGRLNLQVKWRMFCFHTRVNPIYLYFMLRIQTIGKIMNRISRVSKNMA